MNAALWHDSQNIEDREDGMVTSGWDDAHAKVGVDEALRDFEPAQDAGGGGGRA